MNLLVAAIACTFTGGSVAVQPDYTPPPPAYYYYYYPPPVIVAPPASSQPNQPGTIVYGYPHNPPANYAPVVPYGGFVRTPGPKPQVGF